MINRKMIPGLRHQYGADDGAFFEAIDAAGGWPVGYQFVGFEHTESRAAGFCDSPHNDGYWTVIASADDYYVWKLTPVGLQRIVDAVRDAITIPLIKAERLSIRSWRGYRAALSK